MLLTLEKIIDVQSQQKVRTPTKPKKIKFDADAFFDFDEAFNEGIKFKTEAKNKVVDPFSQMLHNPSTNPSSNVNKIDLNDLFASSPPDN